MLTDPRSPRRDLGPASPIEPEAAGHSDHSHHGRSGPWPYPPAGDITATTASCGVSEVCVPCELQRWSASAVGHHDHPYPCACSISSSSGSAAGWSCSAGHRQPLRAHPRDHREPDGPWTVQQIRNLLMDLGDRAAGFRFLVRDRAGQFTASFDALLDGAGIEGRENPAPKPSCERLCRKVRAHRRTEVTDRMLIVGQRHLRTILDEYAAHYNGRRPHRSLLLRPPGPTISPPAFPSSESNAGLSSAVSSTSMSGPRRSPGQGQWPSSGTPQVEGMTREEAARLAALHFPMDADDTAALTDALGGHPLAIEHACAILRVQAGELSVREMLDALRSDAKQLFDSAPVEVQLAGLYKMLLNRIEHDPHLALAWRLLQTYAFLTPQTVVDVAGATFASTRRSSVSPGLPRAVQDQALSQGIEGLKKFALLKVCDDGFCCKMLHMHQLTHSLILGLRVEADPDVPVWRQVRRAGMQIIQTANWNGGGPLPHHLIHWTDVIAANLQFDDCKSQEDAYPDRNDIFLLHSFLLRFDRQLGDFAIDDLEHHLKLYLQSASKIGEADSVAKEPLRLELIGSGALRLKEYPKGFRSPDGPKARRFRDLTARFRRDVTQDSLDYLLHEPFIGTVWYPVDTLAAAGSSYPTAAAAEERSELADNVLAAARWQLLVAAIDYDQGEYDASEVNYSRVYEAAIKDNSLASYELASKAALRALELHLRTGSAERLEVWLDRLAAIQTNDTWLGGSHCNISWHLQVQKIHSDIKVAALLNSYNPFPSHAMEVEARGLIKDYRQIIYSMRRHTLEALIPHAEYQLGKVFVFLGELERAETRFMNARRSSQDFFGAEFGEILAEVAHIKVQSFRSSSKPGRRDDSIRRNLDRLRNIADLIAERGYSPYWEGDVGLTAWVLAEQCGDESDEAANEMRDRAETALAQVGRIDRLSRLIGTAPSRMNPAWLLAD
jgi:hypothetical protein